MASMLDICECFVSFSIMQRCLEIFESLGIEFCRQMSAISELLAFVLSKLAA